MTDVPERRCCDVCGKPLRRDNKSGICGARNPDGTRNPACKAEWDRRERERRLGPAAGRCELCGCVLRRHNTTGICKSNPECIRERRSRARPKVQERPARCRHPEGCPRAPRTGGLCNMHAKRFAATGDLGPVGPKIHPVIVRAGDCFGMWMALEDYDRMDGKVLCRCECERIRRVRAKSLTAGTSRSCRCRVGPREHRTVPIVSPGDTFGHLMVLEAGYLYDDLVAVRCECGGAETKKMAGMVRDGKVKSCGCGKGRFTHGLSRHPLYGTWRGIIGRCTNPNDAAYPKYGGDVRRITVCEGWRENPDGLLSFAADMGTRPSVEYSVDRYPDNNGGYWCGHCGECKRKGWPPNCRWATRQQQSENQRKIAELTAANYLLAARLEEAEQRLLVTPPRKRVTLLAAQETLF